MNSGPNLLYIHSDQHNPYVTGCYGDRLVETPNLDRLAKNGVIFENAYCPSPLCVPSRMAMLAGCHPHQIQVWANRDILDSGIPTLAHSMGAAGYHPVLIGRMHALGPDQLHGYAQRYVGDHRPNYAGGRPVDHGAFEGTQDPKRISLEKSGAGQSAYQVHDEYVTAAAVDTLNRIGIERKCGLNRKPFCLSVGFMLPHQPFLAHRADYERYEGRMGMPAVDEPFSSSLHPYLRRWREQCGIADVSADEVIRARTAYWALVTRLDAMIGDILDALRRNGLEENTLIVYTSDHGEQVGEHGLWWKQTFYEASVKVPVILSWPGVLPSGERRSEVISSLDLNATMLDALGAPPLPRSVGRSVLNIAKSGSSGEWRDEAYSELCMDEGVCNRMVRSGRWKLIYYHGFEPQLFDLTADPNETEDLAQRPEFREVRLELLKKVLDGWNPGQIVQQMKLKRQENDILFAWARNTDPADTHRWELRPEMHNLE